MVPVMLRNTYLIYKRDTGLLSFWMIHVYNAILRSFVAAELGGDEHQYSQNVTGQVKVKELIAMAKTISKHGTRVPGVIYRRLQSAISFRTTANEGYQQLAAMNSKPDPQMEKSNVGHKYFIDALKEVFEVLGGHDWERGQQSQARSQADTDKEAELDAELNAAVEEANFAKIFAALGFGNSVNHGPDTTAAESSNGEESDKPKSVADVQQRRRARPGKGKKKKGGKRAKKSKQAAKPEPRTLDQVPFESYRIIEDTDGIVTDYLLAVYALFEESIDLRLYTSGVWHDVVYKGLNGAVAATLADLATAMLKRTESAMMIEFPGHESYETVMQTITRGNIEKMQSNFSISLYTVSNADGRTERTEETTLDVKEQFLIYAYWDLLDFVTDFQATRTGKPTKRMLEQIDKWDPTFDLRRATEEQRLSWRRSYTINWLYDLVNVYSSIVIQRNMMRGENHVYEKVDWSADGQWSQHVRLYGINEFAASVTSLAMQKPGTDVKKRISPSLVFQLQCIVDSFMVSRGWSISSFRGHVLEPPKSGFRPRRDVDLFLDRENERSGKGYLQGSEVLKQLLEQDSMLHGKPGRHQGQIIVLDGLFCDFRDWLGESKYSAGLATLPPSRFSNSNANGLWEYSPLLCGAGLAEGLELGYRFGQLLWDRIPEPMLLVHLHNMLVQKKYLSRPIGLFASLETIFREAFFADARPPASNFAQALSNRVGKNGTHMTQLQQIKRMEQAKSLHSMLDVAANRFFSIKSNLLLYRESAWNLDRIPNEDLGKQTLLLNLRSDAKFSQKSFSATSGSRPLRLESVDDPMSALSELPRREGLSRRELLQAIQLDIYSDICGPFPYSSLNFPG